MNCVSQTLRHLQKENPGSRLLNGDVYLERGMVTGNMKAISHVLPLALCCLVFAPHALSAQQSAAARSDVYVVPFSHLDLFWGGTQEEDLSR
ncbi:MAG: hypothetical protein ABI380_05075, partial [Edaphobacter sp.]